MVIFPDSKGGNVSGTSRQGTPLKSILPANHGDCLRTEMLCIFCTLGSWSMMFDVNICLYQPMLLALLIEYFPLGFGLFFPCVELFWISPACHCWSRAYEEFRPFHGIPFLCATLAVYHIIQFRYVEVS